MYIDKTGRPPIHKYKLPDGNTIDVSVLSKLQLIMMIVIVIIDNDCKY